MDSARFVSGNLPISSAVIASTTPAVSRLMASDVTSDWRNPVTTISSMASAGATLAVSAIAPEQYMAIRIARGFIGMGGNGCRDLFEAHERLDFFKALPPPDSRDHVYSAVPTSGVDLCERFLKPVAGLICRGHFENARAPCPLNLDFGAQRAGPPLTWAAPSKQHS